MSPMGYQDWEDIMTSDRWPVIGGHHWQMATQIFLMLTAIEDFWTPNLKNYDGPNVLYIQKFYQVFATDRPERVGIVT